MLTDIIKFILENKALLEELIGSQYRWEIIDSLMLSSQEHYDNISEIYASCVKEANNEITLIKIFKDFIQIDNTILTLIFLRLKQLEYYYKQIHDNYHKNPETINDLYDNYILDFIKRYGKKSTEFIDQIIYRTNHSVMTKQQFITAIYSLYKLFNFRTIPITLTLLIYNLRDQFNDLLCHNEDFNKLFNKKISEYIQEQIILNNIPLEFFELLSKYFC